MSSDSHFGGERRRNSVSDIPSKCYDVLGHPRRLRILEILGADDRSVPLTELIAEIHARDGFDGAEESSQPSEREIRISLVHNHLPKLADYDVVEWDGETASIGTNVPIPPENIAALLEQASCTDEQLLETVVHPVRMPILRVLEERGHACSIDALAEQLGTRGVGPVSDPETAKIALYHSHLPALADVGVLEYGHGWVEATTATIPTMH